MCKLLTIRMQSYYFLPKIFLRKCDFRRPEPVAERFAGRFMVVSDGLAGGSSPGRSPGRSPGLSGVYSGGSLPVLRREDDLPHRTRGRHPAGGRRMK